MIVCVCHRVSDRDIDREVRAGCPSFEVLQDDLRCGTACGACRDHARDTFDACMAVSMHHRPLVTLAELQHTMHAEHAPATAA